MKKLSTFFLLIISVAAQAEMTGNDLYAKLKSIDTSKNLQGFAYLEGVLDTDGMYLMLDTFSSIDTKKTKQ